MKDNIKKWLNNFSKEFFNKVLIGAMMAVSAWAWMSFQQAKETVKDIASMPAKYAQLLVVLHNDSIHAIAHERQDSIKDVCNAKQYLSLKNYTDSLVTLLDKNEHEDYLDIKQIKHKLHITP